MKERLTQIVSKILGALVMVLGILLIIVVALQVFSRYIPNVSFVWTEELSRLIFVWYAMLSIAVSYIENKHLSLDIFYEKMGPKARKFLDGLELVLIFVTSVTLMTKGYSLLNTVKIQTSPILQVPMSVFYCAIPVGFTFISLFACLQVVEFFVNLVKKEGK